MRYLLDVNALIALGIKHHQFHSRVAQWVSSQSNSSFLTSSITELGFVRIVAQAPIYHLDVTQAKLTLTAMKENGTIPITFIEDANDITLLPDWVSGPSQTTDGHLVELAKAHQAVLATLDPGIPGAYMIP